MFAFTQKLLDSSVLDPFLPFFIFFFLQAKRNKNKRRKERNKEFT